jgi:hypothetical protein
MRKLLKWLAFFLLCLLGAALSYALISAPPVMGGMAAKTMCSCVFVTGRTPESVTERELQVFPGLSSVPLMINYSDSTVEARVLWKTSRAIFRKGLGCTLLADLPEAAVRQQAMFVAQPPKLNPDTLAWPFGNIANGALIPALDYDAVHEAVNRGFSSELPDRPLYTHAIVVVYDGQIIGEQYAEGFDESSRLMGWSMTKSIMNALVGILVREGKLSIEQHAPVLEWRDDERAQITINDLLQASSGLKWSESYTVPSSTFHDMFIRSDDKAGFAAAKKLKHPPGTYFEYSSGTTNILSRIVRQVVGDASYYRFPYEALFYKLGMFSALMEPDASGIDLREHLVIAREQDLSVLGTRRIGLHENLITTGMTASIITSIVAASRTPTGICTILLS